MVSTGALAGQWRTRHVTDTIGRRNSTDQQDAEARPSSSDRPLFSRPDAALAIRQAFANLLHFRGAQRLCGSAGASFSWARAQASIGSALPLVQAFVSRVAQGRKAVHHIADHVIAAAHCHAFEGVAHPVTIRVVWSAFGDMSGTGTRTIHPGSKQALSGGPVFAVARHGSSRIERHRRRQPAKRGKSTLFSRCICSTRSSENFFALA